jgi:phage FluMu gp28-like protein
MVPGPIFIFCAPRLFFGGSEGIGSRFHVLRSRARFRRYGGHRVSISCFALPDSFSIVPRASVPVFMFYAPGLIFGVTEGVGSRFYILRSQTHFLRYRGRHVSISCFARPNSFSTVPRASAPVFMFCVPGFIFGGSEGVGCRFNVLRSRTRFR